MKTEEILEKILRQNEVLISLLGRLAFTEDQVRDIIIKNKQKDMRKKYIKGFNECDGNKNQEEISKIIGVSSATFSPIIHSWEDVGIVYQVHKGGGNFYKKIFPI